MLSYYNERQGAQDDAARKHRENWMDEHRRIDQNENPSAFLAGGASYHKILNQRLQRTYERDFPSFCKERRGEVRSTPARAAPPRSPSPVQASTNLAHPRSTPYGPGLNTNTQSPNASSSSSSTQPERISTLKELMRKKHGTYEEMRAKRWKGRSQLPKKFADTIQYSDHSDKWEAEALNQAKRWKEYLPPKPTWDQEYQEFEDPWEDQALKHVESEANKNWGWSKEWNKP
ncbi:hypothetical protein BDZ45DRAFT_747146 [Acephala macrosclerotiorum]|nr:hypothetical protein BDZ45DRAFT_747146 [Acephala macrosclerotiorum]